MSKIIKCPKCGRENRVKEDFDGTWCVKCGNPFSQYTITSKKIPLKLIVYYDLVFVLFTTSVTLPLSTDEGLSRVIIGIFLATLVLSIAIYYVKVSISEETIKKKALKHGLYVSSFFFFGDLTSYMVRDSLIDIDMVRDHLIEMWFILAISSFIVVYSSSYIILYFLAKAEEAKEIETRREQAKKQETTSNTSHTKSDYEDITEELFKDGQTPREKAVDVFKNVAIKIILFGILLAGLSAPLEPLIGLVGVLLFILFPSVWIYYSIKDSRASKKITKIAKKATDDFLNDKPKSKDANATADAILKYHSILEKGIITQQEFNKIKEDLMNNK